MLENVVTEAFSFSFNCFKSLNLFCSLKAKFVCGFYIELSILCGCNFLGAQKIVWKNR